MIRNRNRTVETINRPVNHPQGEATVVKHCYTKTARPSNGNLPFMKFTELPERSKYFPMHPVFKFVEQYLSNTVLNKKGICAKKRPSARPLRKCPATSAPSSGCCARCIHAPKVLPISKPILTCPAHVHKSSTHTKNMNLKKRSEIQTRFNCQLGSDSTPPSATPLTSSGQIPSCGVGYGINRHVEDLKKEIRDNKMKISKLHSPNDAYVQKLKDEINCGIAKCVAQSRTACYELQEEIRNYRMLQAKAKYSSSCSDVCTVDKLNLDGEIEANEIGENARIGDGSTPNETRSKLCETLWQSKGSFPSSTEVDTLLTTTTNAQFEKKLEEANNLIEKVRDTLRDLGKDIHNAPTKRKESFDLNKKNLLKSSQTDVEKKAKSSRSVSVFPPILRTKSAMKATEQEPEDRKESEELEEGKNISSEVSAVEKDVEEAKSGENEERRCSLATSVDSVILIKERLKAINEEEGHSPESEPPVVRMERGSSPIHELRAESPFKTIYHRYEDSPQPPTPGAETLKRPEDSSPHISFDQQGDLGDTEPASELPLVSSTVSDQKKLEEDEEEEVTIASATTSDETSEATFHKKLSIQVLPPVSIRRGLVIQTALQLSIKPTGSTTNQQSQYRNVGYEEIKAEADGGVQAEPPVKMCPRDCRNEEGGYCRVRPPVASARKVVDAKKIQELDDHAFNVFQSYQILKDGKFSSNTTLNKNADKEANKKTSISSNATSTKSFDKGITKKAPTFEGVEEEVPERALPTRSPWEIGFYKSVSTQCSSTILPASDSDKPFAAERIMLKPAPTLQTESIVYPAERISGVVGPHSEVDYSSFDDTSEDKFSTHLPHDADKEVEPVQDIPEPKQKSITPVSLSLASSLDESVASSNGNQNVSISVEKKTAPQSVSSSSSSVLERKFYGSKSSISSSSTESVTPTIPEATPMTKVTIDDIKPPMSHIQSEDLEKIRKMSTYMMPSPKEKVDVNIQVDLGSSSSDPELSDYANDRKSDNVADFIKELTGTSREQLSKLRSIPSLFPMVSKTQLRGDGEESTQTPPRRKSIVDDLRDIKRKSSSLDFRESAGVPKQLRDKTVLTIHREKRHAGDVAAPTKDFTKRHLPFYRRVLGRIIEPSSKIEKSHSDAKPLDESLSEGEIRSKSSLSIGELKPFKNNSLGRSKLTKESTKQRKNDAQDATTNWRTGRQRERYNEWMTQYLEKQRNSLGFNDSSFSSLASSPKK